MIILMDRAITAKRFAIFVVGSIVFGATACGPTTDNTSTGPTTTDNKPTGNAKVDQKPAGGTSAATTDERPQPTNKSQGETPGGG